MSRGKFEFTGKLLVLGNLAGLVWILLATLPVSMVNDLYGWLFLVSSATTVFVILRRLGCSSCYRCKSCTSGFGRLAAWFFGRRSLKDMNNRTALTFVVFTYALLVPIPVALSVSSIIKEFSTSTFFTMVGLLTISVYSMTTWLKKTQMPKDIR